MKRRDFLRKATVGGFLIINGQLFSGSFTPNDNEVDFRFTIASDGHYG